MRQQALQTIERACSFSRRVSRKRLSVIRGEGRGAGVVVRWSGAWRSVLATPRRFLGGGELVSVELEQVVGGGQEPPFRSDG